MKYISSNKRTVLEFMLELRQIKNFFFIRSTNFILICQPTTVKCLRRIDFQSYRRSISRWVDVRWLQCLRVTVSSSLRPSVQRSPSYCLHPGNTGRGSFRQSARTVYHFNPLKNNGDVCNEVDMFWFVWKQLSLATRILTPLPSHMEKAPNAMLSNWSMYSLTSWVYDRVNAFFM